MKPLSFILGLAVVGALAAPAIARAHATPPVTYISDRDAILEMTAGANKHAVREVKLTPEERRTIEARSGRQADEPVYRFYLGRDENGRLVAAVTFLTEFTVHGPMRVAVALGPDGKVKDARLVEVAAEMAPAVRPLIAGGFLRQFTGLDSGGNFAAAAARAGPQENMAAFYGDAAARLVRHGAILFDVAFRSRGEM